MSTVAPTPPRIGLTQCLAAVAGLSWVVAVALAVVDANARDLPDPMITGALAVAITATLIAVQVGLSYSAQRRLIGAIDDGVKTVTDDTGSIPTITDTMDSLPTLAELVTLIDEQRAQIQVIIENHEWLAMERARLMGALELAQRDRALSPSEYFKVYSDALKDLGDLADGEDPAGT